LSSSHLFNSPCSIYSYNIPKPFLST
jgi:hypothetical protein